jgi:serine/threonine-protein kinase
MLSKSALARPTTEEVLSRIRTPLLSSASSPSAKKLAEVAARISQEQAEREAEIAAQKAKLASRKAMAEAARGSLRFIAETLFGQIAASINAAAPVPQGTPKNPTFEIKLGSGTLTMTVGHFPEVLPAAFGTSNWDVLCGDFIVVQQRARADYLRSASLWYVDRTRTGSFEWIEVSYYNPTLSTSNQPCYLPPGRDADFAVAPLAHTWNIAHPPMTIDGPGMERFIERWSTFLAEAAEGKLQYPSMLPEA